MLATSRGIVAPVDKLTTILARETLISFAILSVLKDRKSAEKLEFHASLVKTCIHLEETRHFSAQLWGKSYHAKNQNCTFITKENSKFRAFNQICGTYRPREGVPYPGTHLNRAAERTPQSPSHVPFEKWPDTHRKCHVFFGGGGGDEYVWGGWIAYIFEVNLWICVCVNI